MSTKDKVPPHNLEAEQATLGALLLDWDAVGAVLPFLRPERFYSLQNQKILEAILSLFNKGIHGDLITIIEELKTTGQIDAAGGLAYITSLTDTVPTSANVEYYAELVFDQFIRRELIKAAADITAKSHDETIQSRAVLEAAQKRIFELSDSKQTVGVKNIQELVAKTIDVIDQLFKNKNAFTGIPSGFTNLDTMTNGFQPSELIIVGARPYFCGAWNSR